MEKEFDIQEYMTAGVETVVGDALKATLKNPKESAYMMRFAAASKKASKRRAKSEREGLHVPPFLIASVTSNCNLHCAGCYSRSNHATEDCEPEDQLTSDEWFHIMAFQTSFLEYEKAGIDVIIRRTRDEKTNKELSRNNLNILLPFHLIAPLKNRRRR